MEERKIPLETISHVLPKKCGIATFDGHVVENALKHPRVSWYKCNSLVDKVGELKYPIEKRDAIREIPKNNAKERKQFGGL